MLRASKTLVETRISVSRQSRAIMTHEEIGILTAYRYSRHY
jgi:hypothetical protein